MYNIHNLKLSTNLIFPIGNTPKVESVNLVPDRKMHLNGRIMNLRPKAGQCKI